MLDRHVKGIDDVKMLAFRYLASRNVKPIEVRRRLRLAPSTYRRYLTEYRRTADRTKGAFAAGGAACGCC